MNSPIIKKAEAFVLSLLETEYSENYYYHNSDHTKEVVETCELIGKESGLSDDELEIVLLAAWFHDVGYIKKIDGHEKISAEYAEQFLKKESYPQNKIDQITNCIYATKVPQRPNNIFEEILCDSDLAHIGKTTFDERNNLFRAEFEFHNERPLTETEWLKSTIDFLNSHRFFTKYAMENFESVKKKNISSLHRKYNSLTSV